MEANTAPGAGDTQSAAPPADTSDTAGGQNATQDQTQNSTTQTPPVDTSNPGDSADNASQGTDGQQDNQQPDPDSTPITDWSSVKLDLPEGMVDETVLGSFGKAAVELGLTPKQARALASWQLDTIAEQRQALMDAGIQQLSKEWGSKAEANQQEVLALISRIDRAAGDDSFSKALGMSGATCFPGVVKGLLSIARMISEDSIGTAGAAGMSEHDETALEGLNAALKEAQRRR